MRLGLEDVEDEQNGESVEGDRDLERAVGENKFFGRAPAAFDLDEVLVAEDAIKDERDRQHHDVIFGHVRCRESVQAVGDDGHPRGQGGELVEEIERIAIEDAARVIGILGHLCQFGPAFARPDQQGQKCGENIKPGGEALCLDQGDACGHPDDVKGRQHDDVEQDDVFQAIWNSSS